MFSRANGICIVITIGSFFDRKEILITAIQMSVLILENLVMGSMKSGVLLYNAFVVSGFEITIPSFGIIIS